MEGIHRTLYPEEGTWQEGTGGEGEGPGADLMGAAAELRGGRLRVLLGFPVASR